MNREQKIIYISNNISNLNLIERKNFAKIIWKNDRNIRNFIEEKNDGILIKTDNLGDKLIDKLYNFIKNLLC